MITIKKDGETVVCSKGTYESMFKRLGYEIVNESKKNEIQKEQKVETQKIENKLENEIADIPVIEESVFSKSKIGKNKK